jgi:hypothetical protein
LEFVYKDQAIYSTLAPNIFCWWIIIVILPKLCHPHGPWQLLMFSLVLWKVIKWYFCAILSKKKVKFLKFRHFMASWSSVISYQIISNRFHPRFFGGVRVAHLFSFLCCPIMCLYVLSSVLWYQLRFPYKNDVWSLPPLVFSRAHVLFTLFVFVCA